MTASNTNALIQKHRDVATEKQCRPKGDPLHSITEKVKRDLDARKEMGLYAYGEELRPFNGRDPMVDMYQEQLDALLYMRQQIFEQDKIKQAVRDFILAPSTARAKKAGELLAKWAEL